jgi:hypothetical protein
MRTVKPISLLNDTVTRAGTTRAMVAATLVAFCACCNTAYTQDLRLGIPGTDSSHAVEFTRMLNDPKQPDHVSGARIVATYRGGSPTLPISRDRIQKFSDALQNTWSIPFVSTIADLCNGTDGILLLRCRYKHPDERSGRSRTLQEADFCG